MSLLIMQRDRSSKKPFNGKIGSTENQNTDTMPPQFSFEKMREGTGYSVSCCDQINQSALVKQLFQLSRMKWSEIRNAPRHGVGTEKIPRHQIKAPLPQGISDDVEIIALRYNGKKPMLGYRDGRTFQILLLDHDFTAYDHGS